MNRKEKIKRLLPIIRERQVILDEMLANTMAGRPTSCETCTSPGCCYQKTLMQFGEAVLVADHLKKNKLDTPELRKKLREVGEEMEKTPRVAWFSKKMPCVFLDENNRCSVYAIRPLECRTHYVVSPVENCQPPESLPIQKADFRMLQLREMQQLIATHLFWSLPETAEKTYMRSIPMAVFVALKFLEDPRPAVVDKYTWPHPIDIDKEG